jgi:alpha-mannosidase
MRRMHPVPQATVLFTALLVALASWLAVAKAQEGAAPARVQAGAAVTQPAGGTAVARDANSEGAAAIFTRENPALYVVATAHLDTQWRWTIRDAIEQYIPATLRENFALFDRYPAYTFSFEGAFRYMLMKEYYPEEYQRLRQYIATGRWRVAGSWVDAVDTNIPSPEALVRQALYGNGYFWREFGVTSRDIFLPDCFGFGYALPSIAAHCGVTGFSSQKLGWGSAVGVPFDVGTWEGVDGSRLVAAINPGAYVAKLSGDQSTDSLWIARATAQGDTSGSYVAMRYFGVGDQGGAPDSSSVDWLVKSTEGSGPLRVKSVASDQLARDFTGGIRANLATGLRPELFTEQAANPAIARMTRLPHYRGELLMTDHGAGCYTSEAAMKRWNRKNERLADAAERAAVIAHWLGGMLYPRETLSNAWVRFLWHQFHDDLTGTSIPEAYAYSWNDEVISMNEFASVLSNGAGTVCRALDTNVAGSPIVVYNPLSIDRTDAVTATISFDGPAPNGVRVLDPDGREVPSQILESTGTTADILFLARVPSVGFAVYDVRAADTPCSLATGLTVSERGLENGRYGVALDYNGDIASIFDKQAGREMLASPLQLQLIDDEPTEWPAWEVDFTDLMAAPRAVVAGPAWVRVIETGPARAGVEVVRECEGSRFVQRIYLTAGDADDFLTIDHEIDWRTPGTLLKAAFPLAVQNQRAIYDLGLGTIARATNHPKLYEVPAQQWAELADTTGTYGIAILNDCRYGWDKPDDRTLRLSLVRTPRVNANWQWVADQGSQDLGRHRVTCALYSHTDDWRAGRVTERGDRLNQPLRAFTTPKHIGTLGRTYSFVQVRTAGTVQPAPGPGLPRPPVAVRALKLAEETDEIVVRLQELHGQPLQNVQVVFKPLVKSAREVNGAEEPVSESAEIACGNLVADFAPYQLRTFIVRLADPAVRLGPPVAQALGIPYNLDGISTDTDRSDGDFDGAGHSLSGDLIPEVLVREGIPFQMGLSSSGASNVVACRGQRLPFPSGDYDRLYVLAAAVGGDRPATFVIETPEEGPRRVELWIQDYAEPIGQWDSRLVGGQVIEDARSILPAYIKREPVAWVGTHRHNAAGENEAYALTHICKYRIDLPPGTRAVTLPDDDHVRILAATVARNPNDQALPAAPLYDASPATVVQIDAAMPAFVDSMQVALRSPTPRAVIRYTLDGSQPTRQSPVYRGPITIKEAVALKARAFAEGLDDEFVTSAAFTRLIPRPAEAVPDAQPGLVRRYAEGAWDRLPDFTLLESVRTFVAPEIAFPSDAPAEDFALRFDGYLAVPQDGAYELRLTSDDGSALWMGDVQLIDNDGLHGNLEKRATIALKAGMHPIRVEYFQRGGDRALELWIVGPGMTPQAIPVAWVFHLPPSSDRDSGGRRIPE